MKLNLTGIAEPKVGVVIIYNTQRKLVYMQLKCLLYCLLQLQ